MDDKPNNPLSIVSAIFGVLAILAHCGCCIPIVSYVAWFFVILFELVALVTGFVARSQADGEPDMMANVGLATGAVAVLMSIAYIGLVLLATFGFVGLSILSNA